MSTVIGFIMQKGIGSMFSSGQRQFQWYMSTMSSILGSSSGVGTSYNLSQGPRAGSTRPTDLWHTRLSTSDSAPRSSNPQGLQTLFSNLIGGGSGTQAGSQSQSQNQQNKKKGLLGDVMSGLGI